jgi:DNA invertase Pin-like site-specific DNA recombinase
LAGYSYFYFGVVGVQMKAALYLRVSTSDQTTLNQELELKKYCERESLEVYSIYKDEGISGTKTSRPELDRMLQDMRSKLFDVVVVWKFDRLGRSTAHLLQVLEELKNKGVRLIATSQNIDTSTPMGKFFFTILSGFAEMEREMITERIKLGLARRKNQGKPLGRQKGAKDKARRRRLGYFQREYRNKKAKWHKQTTPQNNTQLTPINLETNKE